MNSADSPHLNQLILLVLCLNLVCLNNHLPASPRVEPPVLDQVGCMFEQEIDLRPMEQRTLDFELTVPDDRQARNR